MHKENVGRAIKNSFGKVIEVDIDLDQSAWGAYMQIRVTLNVSKPILRGKKFNVGTDHSCWIRFSYERLPSFYFCCGCLGHNFKECSQ